jgi:glycosyltransferase involved in cell wall biosynthesis
MHKKFPKVLIVGNTFHNKSGGGITMTNLFKGWPPDKLAVITSFGHISNLEVCNNYYQIGSLEEMVYWPLSLLSSRKYSGPLKKKYSTNGFNNKTTSIIVKVKQYISGYIYKNYIDNYFYSLKISKILKNWIDNFNPDLVYVQISNFRTALFVEDIYKHLNKPLVIHVMDDHFNTKNSKSFMERHWKKRLKKKFEYLLTHSNMNLSICDYMSENYHKLFGHSFSAFHNPVDLDFWSTQMERGYSKDNLKILYAGRIGIGTQNSIVDIAKATDYLAKQKIKVEFEIQALSLPQKVERAISKLNSVKLSNPIEYNSLPEKLSNADLLVLPIDFDEYSKNYLRLSMPTKVSEYLASKTPVLVYAPNDTALSKFFSDNKCGYCFNNRDIIALSKYIVKILKDSEGRKAFSGKGFAIAEERFNAEKVRENFLRILNEVSQENLITKNNIR